MKFKILTKMRSPRWKFTPIHNDIDEFTNALIKTKLLVPPPKPTAQPSFTLGVTKECN